MHTGVQGKNVSRLTDVRRASREKVMPLLDFLPAYHYELFKKCGIIKH